MEWTKELVRQSVKNLVKKLIISLAKESLGDQNHLNELNDPNEPNDLNDLNELNDLNHQNELNDY